MIKQKDIKMSIGECDWKLKQKKKLRESNDRKNIFKGKRRRRVQVEYELEKQDYKMALDRIGSSMTKAHAHISCLDTCMLAIS